VVKRRLGIEEDHQQRLGLAGRLAAREAEVAGGRRQAEGPPEPPPPPPPAPLRSALRKPGSAAGSSSGGVKRKAPGGEPVKVSIEEMPRLRRIENFKHLVDDLWYPGFMVECDRCEQPVQWGMEGSIMGAPGRSRFAQGQVLCNCCLSDKLYSEIGAWIVVALAAGSGADSGGSCSVAEAPVTSLLSTLVNLGPSGDAKADLLVAILGSDAEDPDVRSAVLRKARSNVGNLLSYRFLAGAALKQERAAEEEGARAASNDSSSRPCAEGGTDLPPETEEAGPSDRPPAAAKRNNAKAAGAKSSGAEASGEAAAKPSSGLPRARAAGAKLGSASLPRAAAARAARGARGKAGAKAGGGASAASGAGDGKPAAKRQRTSK